MTNLCGTRRIEEELEQALSGQIKAMPRKTSRSLVKMACEAWAWLAQKRTSQLAMRRLRVSETISLGEKRFVSILQVDGAQFLIGGAAGSLSLLAALESQPGTEDAAWRRSAETGKV